MADSKTPIQPSVSEPKKEPLRAFKLLAGKHVGADPETGLSRTYDAGETVHTPIDLVARFGVSKFAPLEFAGQLSQQPVAPVAPPTKGEILKGYEPLDDKTLADLRNICETEEIYLPPDATTKARIIEVLRSKK